MFRWAGKVALVTGASSGIGASIVKDLAKQGVITVAVARRLDRIQELANEVKNEPGKVYPVKADLTNEQDIVNTFDWVEKTLKKPVHVLVNNAGVSVLRNTIDAKMDEWKKMFDTNVYAVGICIREQLKSMKSHNVNDGHIINICSIVGHRIVDFPGFYVYTATKHAVKVITEGVRQELLKEQSQTKVTSISPGYVATELFDQASEYSAESQEALNTFSHLQSSDISNAVIYALSLPQNVRIHELTVQATGEKF
ncbi:farnesol dehydrogenase [Halyomorpha halys]|uniref:farnesol dehydrogenase n=1 Tax=Halyomorpha halys TaxID=286706 RepID=UPI0006D4EC01|nr:farnesol dehydrogenase-like [Halyomorpha halys]